MSLAKYDVCIHPAVTASSITNSDTALAPRTQKSLDLSLVFKLLLSLLVNHTLADDSWFFDCPFASCSVLLLTTNLKSRSVSVVHSNR